MLGLRRIIGRTLGNDVPENQSTAQTYAGIVARLANRRLSDNECVAIIQTAIDARAATKGTARWVIADKLYQLALNDEELAYHRRRDLLIRTFTDFSHQEKTNIARLAPTADVLEPHLEAIREPAGPFDLVRSHPRDRIRKYDDIQSILHSNDKTAYPWLDQLSAADKNKNQSSDFVIEQMRGFVDSLEKAARQRHVLSESPAVDFYADFVASLTEEFREDFAASISILESHLNGHPESSCGEFLKFSAQILVERKVQSVVDDIAYDLMEIAAQRHGSDTGHLNVGPILALRSLHKNWADASASISSNERLGRLEKSYPYCRPFPSGRDDFYRAVIYCFIEQNIARANCRVLEDLAKSVSKIVADLPGDSAARDELLFFVGFIRNVVRQLTSSRHFSVQHFQSHFAKNDRLARAMDIAMRQLTAKTIVDHFRLCSHEYINDYCALNVLSQDRPVSDALLSLHVVGQALGCEVHLHHLRPQRLPVADGPELVQVSAWREGDMPWLSEQEFPIVVHMFLEYRDCAILYSTHDPVVEQPEQHR